MTRFTTNPSPETFKKALHACMPYYFPQWNLEKGRKLWETIPFTYEPAVWWQKTAVKINFDAKWIPQKVETLIVGAEYDAITPFSLYAQDVRFNRPNIQKCFIENAGHFPWVEQPGTVRELFDGFCRRIQRLDTNHRKFLKNNLTKVTKFC